MRVPMPHILPPPVGFLLLKTSPLTQEALPHRVFSLAPFCVHWAHEQDGSDPNRVAGSTGERGPKTLHRRTVACPRPRHNSPSGPTERCGSKGGRRRTGTAVSRAAGPEGVPQRPPCSSGQEHWAERYWASRPTVRAAAGAVTRARCAGGVSGGGGGSTHLHPN